MSGEFWRMSSEGVWPRWTFCPVSVNQGLQHVQWKLWCLPHTLQSNVRQELKMSGKGLAVGQTKCPAKLKRISRTLEITQKKCENSWMHNTYKNIHDKHIPIYNFSRIYRIHSLSAEMHHLPINKKFYYALLTLEKPIYSNYLLSELEIIIVSGYGSKIGLR